MGRPRGNRLLRIFLSTLILASIVGCAPVLFRAHPQLEEKVTSIKTVAIMPPSLRVYQLSAGGDRKFVEDSTTAATQNVARAIEEKLKGHSGFAFTPFPSPSGLRDTSSSLGAAGLKDELEDTQALFEALGASVLLHTYKPKAGGAADQTFPEKLKNFDYSLGPDVQRLAKLANADALLFISGVDHISTGGRKALMTLAILLQVAAHAAVRAAPGPGGASHGFSVAPPPSSYMPIPMVAPTWGTTSLSVALVDGGTGAVLWYNVVGFGAWSSLTDPRSAADLVEDVFTGFPVSGRQARKN